jgi:cytochrome P450
MAGTVQKIDLISQAFARDPFPTYARLREVGPVLLTRLPLLGKTWVATTYQVASEILKDDATFVMETKKVGKTLFSGILRLMPRTLKVVSDHMLTHDNPDHHRLRRLVEQAFSRHSVENLRGRIGVLCDGLLDGLAGKPTVDLLEEWARPLPVAVIGELLGLPDEDRPQFTRWANAFFSSIMSLFGMLRALPAMFRLVRYFRRHFEQCRQLPRPGLMTSLVQAEQDGDKLSEDELLAMAFLLLIAGFETTVHLLSGGTLALLKTPEQKERLLHDWSLLPPAVEELLRFVSPVHMAQPRYVSRDLLVPASADLPHQRRIFAHLVAKLLVHAHDKRIGRLDACQRRLEATADLGWVGHAPAGGQHLVDEARLARRLDHPEHARRVGGQVDLAQGQLVAEQTLELLTRPGQIIEAAHVVIDVPVALLGQLDQGRVVSREPDQHTLVADTAKQAGQDVELVLAVQPFRERTVRRDADRPVPGRVLNVLRVLVPVRLAQAQPVHAAARLAITIDVLNCAFGVTVLKGVDAGLLAAPQELLNAVGRVPGGHVLAKQAVEVRVAVHRVATHDEPADGVGSQTDGG